MVERPWGRRAFLQAGTLVLTSGVLGSLSAARADARSPIKIGLITDLHYADKPTSGTRHYRESLAKLAEAISQFQKEEVDFIVELGDLIDTAPDLETETGYVKAINEPLSRSRLECHYVLGNHCVERLTKSEFLTEVGQQQSYEAFDRSGIHFIILDACFRSDGVPYGRKNSDWKDAFIPPDEVAWLKADLQETDKPAIVFIHQRLDVNNHYAPSNATEIRQLLEASGKVTAVFQGHSHKNDYHEINGIHYCTLAALIEGPAPESNSYSVLTIQPNGSLQVTGFRKQANYSWQPQKAGSR